jgi:hypothetical protein
MPISHQLPTAVSLWHGANAQAPWLNTQASNNHAFIV